MTSNLAIKIRQIRGGLIEELVTKCLCTPVSERSALCAVLSDKEVFRSFFCLFFNWLTQQTVYRAVDYYNK